MEGHIDPFEGDGGEAALEIDGFGFRFCLLGASADNFDKVGFNVLERHGLHEGLNIHFLGFEVVGHIRETV